MFVVDCYSQPYSGLNCNEESKNEMILEHNLRFSYHDICRGIELGYM